MGRPKGHKLSEETKAKMRMAHIKKRGRPRLEGGAAMAGKVGLRGKGERKTPRKPRRLHFPKKPAGMTEGEYRV